MIDCPVLQQLPYQLPNDPGIQSAQCEQTRIASIIVAPSDLGPPVESANVWDNNDRQVQEDDGQTFYYFKLTNQY